VLLEARFPTSAEELPLAAVAYVADNMKVPAPDLTSYRWTGRTIEYHRAQMFGLDQAALAQQLYDAREKTVQRIAGLFDVPRSTIYGDFDQAATTVEPLARTPDRGATGR
jgi:hypothetical protein